MKTIEAVDTYSIERGNQLAYSLNQLQTSTKEMEAGKSLSMFKDVDGQNQLMELTPRLMFATFYVARLLHKDLKESGHEQLAREIVGEVKRGRNRPIKRNLVHN